MSRAVPCLVGAALVLTLGACSMPTWLGSDADLAAAEVALLGEPSTCDGSASP